MIRFCKIIAAYGAKIGGVDKLVPHLGNTGKTFQMYLSLGINLVRAHRVLKFKQSH